MPSVRLWLAVGFLIVLVLAAIAYARLPRRDLGIFATNPPTPYFHYTPIGISQGRILVVHGLDASKNVTSMLSYALTDAGFEVFSIDLPGHGDSPVPFTGSAPRMR
jgi:alpha-beta hydrolase superfamily lysophospholipase